MTYVYRDPGRLSGRPVHVPEDVPEREPPYVVPPKNDPSPLPPPLWGGALGLELASAEVNDWERRNPRHQPTEREHS
jgi:hypothetical protein